MKKPFLSFLLVTLSLQLVQAQRVTDQLDRGLIALPAQSGGYLVSWRLLAEEYYDVTYNVYRDGEVIATGLSVSNFRDPSGSASSMYSVSAVIDGVEQAQCPAVQAWNKKYKEIVLTHEGIRSTLVPNDACCADVDGDGELEILMKFDNLSEIEQSYPKNGPVVNGTSTHEYSIFECLKLDGTRLWWVNCGPNMGDFQNNEQNIVAYDWDCDGKAEAVMRAADGTTIHLADGTTYTVGNASLNYRGATGGGTNWFMCQGNEYLVYMNGATGEPYQCITYPLARLEQGESDLNKAWGDGYGHRCSKFFFGAPYLDGNKPSIFLARGIYTRHKMIAYDVNPTNHQLVERWHWYNNTNGAWKGQGYHNYSIADVDMDGRDEIVFGSMVIDDNGKGLSTTALGHGDAQHVGDFNPYIPGLEIYACNEDHPGNNYRDATTSKIYHRFSAGNDDGRAMMDNFSDNYPGSIGCSAREGAISSVSNEAVSGMEATGINTNFRIYWDGDLCSETFNYQNGKNTAGVIAKYGSWSPIYTCEGSMTNNDTKGTPCYQGDIFGDWREEIIMRDGNNNIRIYSTPVATTYRNYSLWFDHQYRNAMVWQMCGYNQPPHVSYFLGKMEGITMAPPPLTLTGREQVFNGGTVGSAFNGKHAIVCEKGNSNVTLESGIQPSVLTFNVPTWVQGNGASECTAQNINITYTTYSCTVSGGGMSGKGRLVKQGDGILNLPKTAFTHTGETNIWGGTLNFDGQMKQSPLWLNRHTTLNSDGGEFLSISADYGSTIRPGGVDKKGTIKSDSLKLGFGSRVVLDLYSENQSSDLFELKYLSIEHKQTTPWVLAGPKYLAPVIEVVAHPATGETRLAPGKYVIANVSGTVFGSLDAVVVEGLAGMKYKLVKEGNQIVLEIFSLRESANVVWTGANNSVWNLAETENFSLNGEPTVFVSNDEVNFADAAAQKSVEVSGSVIPDTIRVHATGTYIFSGSGSIDGSAKFVNEAGTVVMSGANTYTGGNYLRGGVTKVSLLANQYSEVGNLGGMTSTGKFTMENGAVLQTTAAVEMGSPMKMIGSEGGVLDNTSDFKMDKAITGTLLTKKGNGCLFLYANNAVQRIVMQSGSMTLAAGATSTSNTIELQGGILYDDGQNTGHGISVAEGKSAAWHLTYTYYTAYSNKLTGKGTLTVVPRNAVSRVRITGDWSEFEGTVKHTNKDIWLPFDCSAGMPNATLDLAEGCGASNVCKTFTIGALTGKGALYEPRSNFQSQGTPSGSNTWKVGNSWEDGDFTFEGKISDGGGSNKSNFEKIGNCTMTVKGAWDNTGTVKVTAGGLKLNGSSVSLGTGALTVAKSATLLGTMSSSACLKNSSITINGTLQAGNSTTLTYGTIAFNNQTVTISSSGTLAFTIGKASTSASTMSGTSIKDINKLVLNGCIKLYPYGYEPKAGDEIRLWKNVTTVTGTPDISMEGWDCTFDTSRLSEGVVVVVSAATGLETIDAENDNKDPYYNLVGQPVEQTTQGIYIHHGKKVIIK